MLHRAPGATTVRCIHPNFATGLLQVDFPFDPEAKRFRPTNVAWVTDVYMGLRACLNYSAELSARNRRDTHPRLAFDDLNHLIPNLNGAGGETILMSGTWTWSLIDWLCHMLSEESEDAEVIHVDAGVRPGHADAEHLVGQFLLMITGTCCVRDVDRTIEEACRQASHAVLASRPVLAEILGHRSFFLAAQHCSAIATGEAGGDTCAVTVRVGGGDGEVDYAVSTDTVDRRSLPHKNSRPRSCSGCACQSCRRVGT